MNNSCKFCHAKKEKYEINEKLLNAIRLPLAAVIVILSYILNVFLFNKLDSSSQLVFRICFIVLFVLSYLSLTFDLFIKIFKDLKNKRFFTDTTLTIIATIAAFIIQVYEEAILVIFFYQIGEILEDYATSKSNKQIEKLINSDTLICHLFNTENNTFVDVEPTNVKIGDIIEIRPNEKVPLDGLVIKGNSYLDLSALNGESFPIAIQEKSNVLSGSLNKDSIFLMEVTKSYNDSTLTKIIELIKNEEAKKSSTEKFITKFAKYYTPSVLIIAILYFIIPLAINKFSFDQNAINYLKGAINVLLISCPCSLVVSIPLVFFISMGKQSKIGVLIKGSYNIEELSKCNVFAFDKTNTLTKGVFKIKNKNNYEYEIIASSIESKFSHPIAKSIASLVNKDELLEPTNVNNFPGQGVEGTINNITYRIGERSFLEEKNIKFEESNSSNKVIYLGDITNNKYLSSFEIEDEIKENAKEVIEEFNKNKVKTVMLSGDSNSIAESVGSELKLTEVYGQLMPEDKLEKIKEFQNKKNKVCYIGDGVNDSPSLLRANVGISMGKLGSDAAKESASIVVLNDNLKTIHRSYIFSKKTVTIAIENIVMILLVKLIIMILTLPVFTFQQQDYWMIISILSDVGMLLVAILNSTRLFIKKI